MHKKGLLMLGSFLFFLGFVIFTFLVKSDVFTQLDFNALVKIQDAVPRKIDKLLNIFALIGTFPIVTIFLISFLVLRKKLSGVIIFFSYLSAHALEFIFKEISKQAGPPYLFHRRYEAAGFDKSYVLPDSSYPSGHAMRAVFMLIVICYLLIGNRRLPKNKKITGLIFLSSVAVGIIVSKAVFGEHWVTDLVGGGMLGVSLACFALLFL
ncbi:MAG: phosphatase PAP2 family protein [Patescibacteria group bacterium]